MNNTNRLQEQKTRASILLKHLKGEDSTRQHKAAERFLQLPFLQLSNAQAILNDTDFYRLKHAYHVLAVENGFDNWAAFREAIITEDCMYTAGCGAYLNVWFKHYPEAAAYHLANGGYLLQYRKDYYVAEHAVIEVLGLQNLSAEWKAMGNNWVQPANKEAWEKIYNVAKENYLKPTLPYKAPDKTKRPAWLQNA